MPLRGALVLPMTVAPLGVGRGLSVEAVNRALAGDRMILTLLQKNDNEEPSADDLHRVGTVAIIRQMAKAPTGVRVLVEGVARVRAEFLQSERGYFTALIKPLPEPVASSLEVDARVRRLQELVDRALSLATGLSPDLRTLVSNVDDPLRIAYLLASLIDMKPEDKQRLLEEDNVVVKLDAVASALAREIDVLELKGQIESKAEKEMSDAQRQYMLRQQMKAIQSELGEGDTEIQELRKRIADAHLPEAVADDRHSRGRSSRADDGRVPRIPDDPDLPGLGARRPLGQADRRSARPDRGASRPRRRSLRPRQGQGTHCRIPRRYASSRET